MGSNLMFRFRSGTHGLNDKKYVDIVLETVVKLVFFFVSVGASL